MAKEKPGGDLARRERQIMDAIHQLGEATVSEVLDQLTEPPTYSSVRTMIRHLENKGLLSHRQDGKRYVYKATQSREAASKSALRKLMDVFFDELPIQDKQRWHFHGFMQQQVHRRLKDLSGETKEPPMEIWVFPSRMARPGFCAVITIGWVAVPGAVKARFASV